MFNSESLQEKWAPVIEHAELPQIKDGYRKAVTALVLENQERAMAEERAQQSFQLTEAAPANATTGGTGNMANWDPILISLVRRAMPNLMAYDIAGVQPMSGPTGLIFAMKSRYTTQGGPEALFGEANTAFSGTGTHSVGDTSSLVGDGTESDTVGDPFGVGEAMTTASGAALGTGGGSCLFYTSAAAAESSVGYVRESRLMSPMTRRT